MKITRIITCAVGLLVSSGVANAAHVWEDPNAWASGVFAYDIQAPRYTANELSLDLFGSYTAPEEKFSKLFETNIRHGDWGGGVGLNYFFTRELGIGTDINASDNRGNFIDMIDLSLIARWPFEPSGFAPYIFGGGGRGTDPEWEWLGHAGLGFEYRWNPATGIFVDGRYIWHETTFDRVLLRAGIRLVF